MLPVTNEQLRYFKQQGADVELWGFDGPGPLSQFCDENNILWKKVKGKPDYKGASATAS